MSQVNIYKQAPITIQKTYVTLQEVTTVSGGDARNSAELDVGGKAHGCVFIDHAFLDTGASGVIGVKYTIEVSQLASGSDNWRPYTSFSTALIGPAPATTPVAGCLPGETTISLASNGASGYTSLDKVFFKNNIDFSKSEWAEVVKAVGATHVLVRDGLTNTQQSSAMFSKAEEYVAFIRFDDVSRVRVTCNNALYAGAKAVAWRARIIYGDA